MIPVNPAIVGIEAVNPTEPLIPVGYFFSFHSIRSHGQSSFFCLWHHDFIKIESQIADIFQLDDDNTPV